MLSCVEPKKYPNKAQCIRDTISNGQYNSHSLTISIVTNQRIRSLNTRYAGNRQTTDVLSFRLTDQSRKSKFNNIPIQSQFQQLSQAPYLDIHTGQFISPLNQINNDYLTTITHDLGTIFLAIDYCNRMANRKNIPLDLYLLLATTHGIAHLTGYDHHTPFEYNQMQQVEREVLKVIQQANLLPQSSNHSKKTLSYL